MLAKEIKLEKTNSCDDFMVIIFMPFHFCFLSACCKLLKSENIWSGFLQEVQIIGILKHAEK